MPVPDMFLLAQLLQGAIDLLARARAALDINQTMRIAPKKTDHAIQRVHGDAVAICVLPRRRDYRTHWNILQFADSLKRVAQLSPFNRELVLVIDMLIRAAAASAEVRALWRDAIRRTLLNFHQLCLAELLLFPDNFGGDQFAINGVRNKNSFALFPSNAFSAERDVLNFQINNAHLISTLLPLVFQPKL